MKKKIIKINGEEITVHKMPLGRYVEFFQAFQNSAFVKYFVGMGDITEEKIITRIPEIIAQFFPEFISILSIASGIPKEKFKDEYGLSETIAVIQGILEVNDLSEIKKNIEGVKAMLHTKNLKPTG